MKIRGFKMKIFVSDPDTELRVTNDKIKDYEKHVEFLKIESSRWQDEANELNLKCQTYEAQLEQKSNEYRQQLIEKDVSYFRFIVTNRSID